MGVAMLIRPIAIGMSFIIGVIIWLFARNKKLCPKLFLIIMVFAGNLLTIAPWEGWMYHRTGKIIPLCASGVNAIRDGLTFAVKMKGYRQGVWVPADVRTLQEDINGQYNKLKTVGDVGSILAEKLQTQPAAVVKLFFIKLSRSWYGTDSQKFETLILLSRAFICCLSYGGLGWYWKMGETAKKLAMGIWLIVFYFWGMSIISLTLLRYMVPVMGLLFLLLPAIWKTRLIPIVTVNSDSLADYNLNSVREDGSTNRMGDAGRFLHNCGSMSENPIMKRYIQAVLLIFVLPYISLASFRRITPSANHKFAPSRPASANARSSTRSRRRK